MLLNMNTEDIKNADEVILIDSNNDGMYDTVNVIREAIYCINSLHRMKIHYMIIIISRR